MGNRKILKIFIIGFIVKVILALLLPVFADEAYYYVWTLHPQLSYFDHPPMVSWFIALGNTLLPIGGSFSLRLFFIIASTLAMVIWYFILKRKQVSEKHIEYFLWLSLLNPLLGPGGVVATPDVPLVLLWSLSYLFYLEVLEKKSWKAYSLLGVALGLGFCAKYHIVIFVLSGLIYLVLFKQYRRLVIKFIPLTIIFGLLFSLPVIYWNYQNQWSSFTFQLNHGFGRTYYDWTWTASFILGQIFILNPFLLTNLFKRAANRPDQTFALSQSLFFLTSSFKAVVEANWPITSHLHATSASVTTLSDRRFKWALGYWIVIYLVFAILVISSRTESLFKNQINSAQLAEVLPVVNQYKPLYGPNYQVSSLLTWMSGEQVFKLKGLTRYDFYDSLDQSAPKEQEFYVLKHMTSYWPEAYQKLVITKIQSFEKPQLELFKVTHE